MNYSSIISQSYPDAEFSISGNDYSTLDWKGPGEKPAEATLVGLWPSIEVELRKRELIRLLNRNMANAFRVIKSDYTQEEIDSWSVQKDNAAVWSEGVPNTYIDSYAATSSLSPADIVSRIQAKKTAYEAAAGSIQGQVTVKRDAIKAATKLEQLNIDVTVTPPSI